jgi:hypothetical protein
LGEAVCGRVWVGVLRLRRCLLLVMLLVDNARGSWLLEVVRRSLLRVVGMMLHKKELSAMILSPCGKCNGKI